MAFSIQGFAKITKTTKINTKSGILQTTREKNKLDVTKNLMFLSGLQKI